MVAPNTEMPFLKQPHASMGSTICGDCIPIVVCAQCFPGRIEVYKWRLLKD